MSSRTVLGATLWSNSDTILAKITKLGCTALRLPCVRRLMPSSYQRLYFRNANHPITRPSITTRRQDRTSTNVLLDPTLDQDERKTSHVFDGQTLTKETAAFQLCDITDPMLKGMIEDASELREDCDVCIPSTFVILLFS